MKTQVFPEVALEDTLFELRVLLKANESWQDNLNQLGRLRDSLDKGAIVGTPQGWKWLEDVKRLFERGLEDLELLIDDDKERAVVRERYESVRGQWLSTLTDRIHPRKVERIGEGRVGSWLDRILAEHTRSPFDRVYRVGPKDEPLSKTDFSVVDPLPWRFNSFIEPEAKTSHKGEDDPFSCVASFLESQAKLTLIDGHIFESVPLSSHGNSENPERWRKSLKLMGGHAARGNPLIQLEIHTWAKSVRNQRQTLSQADKLHKLIGEYFGTPPTISVWPRDKDVDHGRWVLGSKFGFQSERGLDLLGKTPTIHPIGQELIHKQLRLYSRNRRGPPFVLRHAT